MDSPCLLLKSLTVHGSRHIIINKNIFDGKQELLPGIINENGENCSRSICRVHLALLQEHHHKNNYGTCKIHSP